MKNKPKIIEKDVQSRILEAIYLGGKKATKKEIMKRSNLSKNSVRAGIPHLRDRSMIIPKWKNPKKHTHPSGATYYLNTKNPIIFNKIKNLIMEVREKRARGESFKRRLE